MQNNFSFGAFVVKYSLMFGSDSPSCLVCFITWSVWRSLHIPSLANWTDFQRFVCMKTSRGLAFVCVVEKLCFLNGDRLVSGGILRFTRHTSVPAVLKGFHNHTSTLASLPVSRFIIRLHGHQSRCVWDLMHKCWVLLRCKFTSTQTACWADGFIKMQTVKHLQQCNINSAFLLRAVQLAGMNNSNRLFGAVFIEITHSLFVYAKMMG